MQGSVFDQGASETWLGMDQFNRGWYCVVIRELVRSEIHSKKGFSDRGFVQKQDDSFRVFI